MTTFGIAAYSFHMFGFHQAKRISWNREELGPLLEVTRINIGT